MIFWHMSVKNLTQSSISLVLTHPDQMAKQKTLNKFLKASIRKLCQEDIKAWVKVLPQVLFAYRCCPHTSTGESPYTLVHGRDPVLPIHKLIKVTTPYQGESSLGNILSNPESLYQ